MKPTTEKQLQEAYGLVSAIRGTSPAIRHAESTIGPRNVAAIVAEVLEYRKQQAEKQSVWHTAKNGVELACRKCGRWTEGRANRRPICRGCFDA